MIEVDYRDVVNKSETPSFRKFSTTLTTFLFIDPEKGKKDKHNIFQNLTNFEISFYLILNLKIVGKRESYIQPYQHSYFNKLKYINKKI